MPVTVVSQEEVIPVEVIPHEEAAPVEEVVSGIAPEFLLEIKAITVSSAAYFIKIY